MQDQFPTQPVTAASVISSARLHGRPMQPEGDEADDAEERQEVARDADELAIQMVRKPGSRKMLTGGVACGSDVIQALSYHGWEARDGCLPAC